MAAAVDLSGLPDNLLRGILDFAPDEEAASTAINLDSRSYDSAYDRQPPYGLDDVSGKIEAFTRDMEAALSAAAAAGDPVRRLTLYVDKVCYQNHFYAAYREHGGRGHDMIASLLSSPAARAAEEVAVVIAPRRGFAADDDRQMNSSSLSFGSLPSETLRALHAGNIGSLAAPPPAAVFPRLAELRLRRCGVSVPDLQRVIDAAPQLATLHLERYTFGKRSATATIGQKTPGGRLVCPAVTTLVLKDCSWPWVEQGRVELDVPRLQYFRYKGKVGLVMERVFVKLSAASPSVVGVDLHFDAESWRNARTPGYFWEFVQSFNTAKVLKLKMDLKTDDVDPVYKQDELVDGNRLFHTLERLEVEVSREPGGETLALFIANLLRCCPVVRDLHLKFTPKESNGTGLGAWAEFDKAVDHFRHHSKSPKILLNADEDENCMVSDIPGLSDQSFDCLKSCLRRVILQFWMEGRNCFEVQLAKFFAENAMVLQEISIHDGNHKLRDHINSMLRRWVASGSYKCKNSPTTTAFRESCPRERQRELCVYEE